MFVGLGIGGESTEIAPESPACWMRLKQSISPAKPQAPIEYSVFPNSPFMEIFGFPNTTQGRRFDIVKDDIKK